MAVKRPGKKAAAKKFKGVRVDRNGSAPYKASTGMQPGHDRQLEVTDEFANPLYLLVISAEKSL